MRKHYVTYIAVHMYKAHQPTPQNLRIPFHPYQVSLNMPTLWVYVIETQLLRIHYLNMNYKVYFTGHYFWIVLLILDTKPPQFHTNPD